MDYTDPSVGRLRLAQMSDNAKRIFKERYCLPNETIEDAVWRVAKHISRLNPEWEVPFFNHIATFTGVPNSPTFTGAGTPLAQLSACFTLDIEDSIESIMGTLKDAAVIQKSGGGLGFNFSKIRPKNALIVSTRKQSQGVCSWIKMYDGVFSNILQAARWGAHMAILRCDHPDVFDFIELKSQETSVTNFNISILFDRNFMTALQTNKSIEMWWTNPAGERIVEDVIPAKDIWNAFIQHTWQHSEPSALFEDNINRDNPLESVYGRYVVTNPCVTGDTLVSTAQGLFPIKTLVNKNPRVLRDARFGQDKFSDPVPVFPTGKQQVYQLKTKEGYTVKATANHEIMTSAGWRALKDLQPKDIIYIANQKGGFGAEGSLGDGRMVGWIVADGTVNSDHVILYFYDKKIELAEEFLGYAQTIVTDQGLREREYTLDLHKNEESNFNQIKSTRLLDWWEQNGFGDKLNPQRIGEYSEDFQRGYLQGLFSADGTFLSNVNKGISVRLASNSIPLLESTQRLLLNFGIYSKIYLNRRDAGYRMLPDGKGGSKEYWCEAQHELVISKNAVDKYLQEIGFLLGYKQDALEAALQNRVRGSYATAFTATVKSIEPLGVETVYDLTEVGTSAFIANGIVVHNCAEIPMKEYESCNLSCLALDNFVDWEGDFRWEEFKEAIRVNTYLLNGIVDTNELPVPQTVEMNRKYRRIGNGITGLHDAMIKMGVPYNSSEGLQFIEKIMAYVTFYGLKTSNEIAQERGIVFEDFEQSIYATGLKSLSLDFSKHHPIEEIEQLSENIRNHGLANTHVSMIAPTGTRSTVSDKGGYGVEPIFAYSYKRWVVENNGSENRYSISVVPKIFNEYLDRYKQEFDRTEILEAIEDNYGSIQGLDKYFSKLEQQLLVDANSIAPDDHVRVLAAAQVYTQQSISKTVNCPHNTSVEELIVLFEKAWEMGCKGLTVYRNASRNKVVIETTKKLIEVEETPAVTLQENPESWDDMVCNLVDGVCLSCA